MTKLWRDMDVDARRAAVTDVVIGERAFLEALRSAHPQAALHFGVAGDPASVPSKGADARDFAVLVLVEATGDNRGLIERETVDSLARYFGDLLPRSSVRRVPIVVKGEGTTVDARIAPV